MNTLYQQLQENANMLQDLQRGMRAAADILTHLSDDTFPASEDKTDEEKAARRQFRKARRQAKTAVDTLTTLQILIHYGTGTPEHRESGR